MSDTLTAILGLEQPGFNTFGNAWDQHVNANTRRIENAIAGALSVDVTGGSATLTASDSAATSSDAQARYAVIQATGTPSGAAQVLWPSAPGSKFYLLVNGTSKTVTFLVSGKTGVAVTAGSRILAWCNGTDLVYAQTVVPGLVGEVKTFAGASCPPLWLPCDGRAVSRSTYALLFQAIGTTYGNGDGSTTFNVPDWRGRAVAGADAMFGGTSAGRLYGVGPGWAGGEATHTLTTNEMPAHSHGVTDPGHQHAITDPGHAHSLTVANGAGIASGTNGGWAGNGSGSTATDRSYTGITVNGSGTGISIQNAGNGAAHNNIQPTLTSNVIIYAGA